MKPNLLRALFARFRRSFARLRVELKSLGHLSTRLPLETAINFAQLNRNVGSETHPAGQKVLRRDMGSASLGQVGLIAKNRDVDETQPSARPKQRGGAVAVSNVHLPRPTGLRPNPSNRAPTRNLVPARYRPDQLLPPEEAAGAGYPRRFPSPRERRRLSRQRPPELRQHTVFF